MQVVDEHVHVREAPLMRAAAVLRLHVKLPLHKWQPLALRREAPLAQAVAILCVKLPSRNQQWLLLTYEAPFA